MKTETLLPWIKALRLRKRKISSSRAECTRMRSSYGKRRVKEGESTCTMIPFQEGKEGKGDKRMNIYFHSSILVIVHKEEEE